MNVRVNTNNKKISYKVTKDEVNNIIKYKIHFYSKTKLMYKKLKIDYSLSLEDIHVYWTPGQFGNRGIQLLWTDWGGFESKATTYAPVGSLLNLNNQNKLTVSLSDAINAHQFIIGMSEERKEILGKIFLFTEETEYRNSYSVILRFDKRQIPFYQSLRDVTKWYETFYPPLKATKDCFSPMYSTWYSFHQNFTASELESQCDEFVKYGLESIIVDDGWQTDDQNRGYAYCGEWEPSVNRFKDGFKTHVENIHRIGMKYLLWYAVPFIGYKSKNYNEFKDKVIYEIDNLETGVLDIRHKEVRDFLISTYVQSVKKYNIDGLKLDFVDSFTLKKENTKSINVYDFKSLQTSFNILFNDIIKELKSIKKDIMIEFRQNYIGPAMRQYGNIFRAADCPGNIIQNRVRTTDLRLLSGNTAVHSDMLMWSQYDTVESAALQIINILFSVPQISVKIEEINEDQKKMLKHWIEFWKNNKSILLCRDFRSYHPEMNYTSLEGRLNNESIIVSFSNKLINLESDIEYTIINGAMIDILPVVLPSNMTCKKFNVYGTFINEEDLSKGLNGIEIPKSGYIKLYMR